MRLLKLRKEEEKAGQEFGIMTQVIGGDILAVLIKGKFSCLQCATIDEIVSFENILVTPKDTWLTRPNRKEHQYCERHLTQLCMGHLW